MASVRIHYEDPLAYYELASFLKNHINKDTIVICIGTDRNIADSLGPLVGTMLSEKIIYLKVYGTLDNPIHALNIERKLNEIKKLHPHSNILGIDACLGDLEEVGQIILKDKPVEPGKGLGKSLPSVGQFCIKGVVESEDNFDLLFANSTRLSLVMNMANTIINAILYTIHLLDDIGEVAVSSDFEEVR